LLLELRRESGAVLQESATFVANTAASAKYRRAMLPVLVRRDPRAVTRRTN